MEKGVKWQSQLEPYDPTTTERSKYSVPLLTEPLKQADELNEECLARQHKP